MAPHQALEALGTAPGTRHPAQGTRPFDSPTVSIPEITDQFQTDLAAVRSDADLKALRDKYLGRKGGAIAALMKGLGAATPEERPRLGQQINDLKQQIESAIEAKDAALAAARQPEGAVDVTLPGRPVSVGRLHPLTQLRARIEAIFARQGYEILDGPETEDDWHNFEALNMPPEHPARDMQDTLYLSEPWDRPVRGSRKAENPKATLLRTHTSAMQIRYMTSHTPPVRVIAPGRVYRRDNFDLSHTPMFTQVECLVVDEHITLADLKGTLFAFARELFGPDRRLRFRPSFFPYTEPSAELDISCAVCKGTGQLPPKLAGTEASAGEGGPVAPKLGGHHSSDITQGHQISILPSR